MAFLDIFRRKGFLAGIALVVGWPKIPFEELGSYGVINPQ
jgi:hypothetical protein